MALEGGDDARFRTVTIGGQHFHTSAELLLRPEADAPFCQPLPVKQLAGVKLAVRGDVGMADNIAGRNVVPVHHAAREFDQRLHLRVRKPAQAITMTGIDQFDANGG